MIGALSAIVEDGVAPDVNPASFAHAPVPPVLADRETDELSEQIDQLRRSELDLSNEA